jgi:hypothetical protein
MTMQAGKQSELHFYNGEKIEAAYNFNFGLLKKLTRLNSVCNVKAILCADERMINEK